MHIGEAAHNAGASASHGHAAPAGYGSGVGVHVEEELNGDVEIDNGLEDVSEEDEEDTDHGGGGDFGDGRSHDITMDHQDDVHMQNDHQQQQQEQSSQQHMMDGRNPVPEDPNERERQHHNQQQQLHCQQNQDHPSQDESAAAAAAQHRNENNRVDPGLAGYDQTAQIGQGAYGTVYRARQRATNTTVAIKRIPFGDANLEGGVPCSVIREISLLRELDHPNVVRLLDVLQEEPGCLFIVFEFVKDDLKKYMDSIQTTDDPLQRRGLPPDKVKSFMQQILAGVGFCHIYRVLHRDLKPHNLLISADGNQVKLADFGLSRLSALPNGPYTQEVVTLWYRAPELLLGANKYSSAVDVWSIGCIFAEMVTGYALFTGRCDIHQLFMIFERRGTPNHQLCPALTRLPHFNPEFPKWAARPITDLIPVEEFGSPAAPDLLEELLKYDPDQRIGCKAALQHPYFHGGF